ncbi:hypothetical protein ACE1BH_08115 [Aeromonas jandaei]
MTNREDYPALLRAQLLQSKSQVPRYWREANQERRAAICFTAQLPFTFARDVLPIGRADKEALRQAVIDLGMQHLFHGRMSEYEWHTGCLPELREEEETKPASELERKRCLLKEVQTTDFEQKKTPLNGAANA